jgi:hypothetical protein
MDQNRRAGSVEAVYGQGLPSDPELGSKIQENLGIIFRSLRGRVCPIVNNRGKNDGKLENGSQNLSLKHHHKPHEGNKKRKSA